MLLSLNVAYTRVKWPILVSLLNTYEYYKTSRKCQEARSVYGMRLYCLGCMLYARVGQPVVIVM